MINAHMRRDAKQFADALENDGWLPFHPSDTKALVRVLRSIEEGATVWPKHKPGTSLHEIILDGVTRDFKDAQIFAESRDRAEKPMIDFYRKALAAMMEVEAVASSGAVSGLGQSHRSVPNHADERVAVAAADANEVRPDLVQRGHGTEIHCGTAGSARPHEADGSPAAALLKPNDLRIDTYQTKSGGFVSSLPVGVRITHLPTGLVANCETERSQHANRDKAWQKLEAMLKGREKPAETACGPTGITDEQIERHTLAAGECPPQSKVLLVSAVKRLMEKNAHAKPADDERQELARMKGVLRTTPGMHGTFDGVDKPAGGWVSDEQIDKVLEAERMRWASRNGPPTYEFALAFARAVLALRPALTAKPAEGGVVDLNDIEQYRLQMAGISTAALGYWKEGDAIHPDYDTLALRDVAKLYTKYDALYKASDRQALIDWVAARWHAEVANRPLINVHRRTLDGTWRQVLRHLGVDDKARLGPTHDELLIGAEEAATRAQKGGD